MSFAEKPSACEGCPARDWGVGFVPPKPASNPSFPSRVALVGQGPGEQEAASSSPFDVKGQAGSLLTDWLHTANVLRNQVWIGNVVQCWLPKSKTRGHPVGNREPTRPEVEHCWRAHVQPALAEFDPTYIVSIGAPATRWFLNFNDKAPTEKYFGTINELVSSVGEFTNTGEGFTDGGNRDRNQESRREASVSGGCEGEARSAPSIHGQSVPGTADQHERTSDHSQERHLSCEVSESGTSRGAEEQPAVSEGVRQLQELSREDAQGTKEVPEVWSPTYVMPIAHPARILRGGWNLQESQTHYLGRLFELARSGDAPYMPNIYEPPPNTILYPTLSDLHEFRLEADRLGAVALDIETAGSHIVCVGCTAMAPDGLVITNTIVLRFRIQGGNIYWSDWKKHVAAVEWLYDLLSSPLVKVFQNGITFDVPELVELGFDVQGPFIDTMHLSYSADVERPKGLQYMSTLFLGMPVWKTLTDGEELEGKD